MAFYWYVPTKVVGYLKPDTDAYGILGREAEEVLFEGTFLSRDGRRETQRARGSRACFPLRWTHAEACAAAVEGEGGALRAPWLPAGAEVVCHEEWRGDARVECVTLVTRLHGYDDDPMPEGCARVEQEGDGPRARFCVRG